MKEIFERITTYLNNIQQTKRKYFVIGFFIICVGLFSLDCYVGSLSENNASNETNINQSVEEIKLHIDSIDIILSQIDSLQ